MHGLAPPCQVAFGLGGTRAVGAGGEAEALQRLLTKSRGLVTDGGGALLGEAAAAGGLLLLEGCCCWRRRAAAIGGRLPGEDELLPGRSRPGGRAGRLSQSAGGSAVLRPGGRVCIFILTVCCFLCQGQSARRANWHLASSGQWHRLSGLLALIRCVASESEAVSALRWVLLITTGLRPGSASSVS